MKIKLVTLILCSLFFFAKAQEKNLTYVFQWHAGLANLNYKNVNNALQSGFNLNIISQRKLHFNFGYQYILGENVKDDDLYSDPKTFYYNRQIQQSQINGMLGYPILSIKRFNVLLQTGLSLNFIKHSYVNNIYYKEIFPNSPLILVSESTFEKKFQLGNISNISSSIRLNKFSPGIGLQYQIQKAYKFFSTALFLNYTL
jgi:hypothetical protein